MGYYKRCAQKNTFYKIKTVIPFCCFVLISSVGGYGQSHGENITEKERHEQGIKELTGVRTGNEKKERKLRGLEGKATYFKKLFADNKTSLSEKSSPLDSARQQNLEHEDTIEFLEKTVDFLNNEREKLLDTQKELQKSLDALAGRYNGLLKEKDSLTSLQGEQSQELTHANKEIISLREALTEKETCLEETTRTCAQKEKELIDTLLKLEEVGLRNKVSEEKISELTVVVKSLQDEKTILTDERKDKTGEIHELTSALEKYKVVFDESVRALKNERSKLSHVILQNEEYQKKIGELAAVITELNAKNCTLADACAGLETRVQAFQEKQSALLKEKEEHTQHKQEFLDTVRVLTREREGLLKEKQLLLEEKEACRNKIVLLEKGVEDVHAKQAAEKKNFEKTLSSLEKEIQQKERTIEGLENSVNSYKNLLSEQNAAHKKQYTRKINKLEKVIEKYKKQQLDMREDLEKTAYINGVNEKKIVLLERTVNSLDTAQNALLKEQKRYIEEKEALELAIQEYKKSFHEAVQSRDAANQEKIQNQEEILTLKKNIALGQRQHEEDLESKELVRINLQNTLTELSQKNRIHEEREEELAGMVKAYEDKVNALLKVQKTHRKEQTSLMREKDTLNEKIAALENAFQQRTVSFKGVESEKERYKNESITLEKEISALKVQDDMLRKENKVLYAAHDKYKQIIAGLKEKNSELEGSLTVNNKLLKEKLAESEKNTIALGEMAHQLENLKFQGQTYERAITQLKEQAALLKNEKEELIQRQAKLEQDAAKLNAAIAEYDSSIDQVLKKHTGIAGTFPETEKTATK